MRIIYICIYLLLAAGALGLGVRLNVTPETIQEITKERVSRPELCKQLYNVDRHREWAKCMGVEYQ